MRRISAAGPRGLFLQRVYICDPISRYATKKERPGGDDGERLTVARVYGVLDGDGGGSVVLGFFFLWGVEMGER